MRVGVRVRLPEVRRPLVGGRPRPRPRPRRTTTRAEPRQQHDAGRPLLRRREIGGDDLSVGGQGQVILVLVVGVVARFLWSACLAVTVTPASCS